MQPHALLRGTSWSVIVALRNSIRSLIARATMELYQLCYDVLVAVPQIAV